VGGTVDRSVEPPGTWTIPCGASAAVINQALADAGAYSASPGGRGRVVFPDGLAFLLDEPLVVPANVDVVAGTALLIAAHADPMVMNSLAGCAGRYAGAGGWTWSGGSLDGANLATHGFSLAHCPGATISGAVVGNTCLKGHAIEINSSGGPPNSKHIEAMTDADFTIKVLGCHFRGVVSRRSNDCDEAVHFDYAWTGATYAVLNDGTVSNNVLIAGCIFDRSGPTAFPYSVGVGAHKFATAPSAGEAAPVALHSRIKIAGNTFTGITPVGLAHERGSVHIRGMTQVIVEGNRFTGCAFGITMEPIRLPAAYGQPSDFLLRGNTFDSCGSAANTRWCLTNSVGASNDPGGTFWSNVRFEGNTFTGTVPATQTTYLISGADVNGLRVVDNRFWGLTGTSPLVGRTGNRIHGTPADPPGQSTRMTLSGNTWSADASGSGAVPADT
jgi:hypothetical protein